MKISFSTTQDRPEWRTTDSEWRDPATNDERDIQTETGLAPGTQREITAEVAAYMMGGDR